MASRIRAPMRGLIEGARPLDGEQAHYLTRVLRLREGDGFVAFDPVLAVECDAVVVRTDDAQTVAQLGPVRPAEVRAARAVTLIQGLAKGDKCDAVVRDATELGATRIVITATARSVVRLDAARGHARVERWTRIASEAARQCGRGDSPTVSLAASWADALGPVTPAVGATARFCLYENATVPLGALLLPLIATDAAVAFAVGPEGGLTEDEVSVAEAAGFRAVTLGPFILRTETVAAAVLGACLLVSP